MTIRHERLTADYGDDLVVFIIGMRINHFLRVGKWLPVLRAMPRMLKELYVDKGSGFLGAEMLRKDMRTPVLIQYWRDFESLEGYARARDREHWPAWLAFNKAVGTDGSVGIFHETYVVQAHAYETIYGNMPPFGLGKVAGLVPATGNRNEARARMTADKG